MSAHLLYPPELCDKMSILSLYSFNSTNRHAKLACQDRLKARIREAMIYIITELMTYDKIILRKAFILVRWNNKPLNIEDLYNKVNHPGNVRSMIFGKVVIVDLNSYGFGVGPAKIMTDQGVLKVDPDNDGKIEMSVDREFVNISYAQLLGLCMYIYANAEQNGKLRRKSVNTSSPIYMDTAKSPYLNPLLEKINIGLYLNKYRQIPEHIRRPRMETVLSPPFHETLPFVTGSIRAFGADTSPFPASNSSPSSDSDDEYIAY